MAPVLRTHASQVFMHIRLVFCFVGRQGHQVRRENYDFVLGGLPVEALSFFDSCILQLGPWMLMMME